MNILHLKYAVEIEKTHSISKAAENLYMGQPNLSRALKELETSLGTKIFRRTNHGIEVTPQGEKFLRYAKQILRQIDGLEEMFRDEHRDRQSFSVSVPRASYISSAFVKFSDMIDKEKPAEIFYKETNSLRAITNILDADYKLGIIRYAENYEKYFSAMLDEKGLAAELIAEFSFVLIMSEKHPLASKDSISFDDLSDFTEIAHADPYVPSLPFSIVRHDELPDDIEKRIYVFERASQFDLLSETEGTFMWVSPVPHELLDKYGLVQRKCSDNKKKYRDVLIYKKDYKLTKLDALFIGEVKKSKQKYL